MIMTHSLLRRWKRSGTRRGGARAEAFGDRLAMKPSAQMPRTFASHLNRWMIIAVSLYTYLLTDAWPGLDQATGAFSAAGRYMLPVSREASPNWTMRSRAWRVAPDSARRRRAMEG